MKTRAAEARCVVLFLCLAQAVAARASTSPRGPETLRTAIDRAEALRKTGDFDKAAVLLQAALKEIPPASPPPADTADGSNLLGLCLWNLGRLPESQAAYEKALAAAAGAGLDAPESFARGALTVIRSYNEGKIYRDTKSDCRAAAEAFRRAISAARALKSPDLELKCLRQLSVCMLDGGDLAEYKRLNEAGLALARAIRLRKDESICLNNLGVYYLKIENYARALASCEQAYDIALKIGYAQGQNEILTNFGILYNDIGNYEKALIYLQKALDLDQAAFGPAYAAIDLNNIGANYRKRALLSGNRAYFVKALECYEKAYALVQGEKDLGKRIRVLNNLGTVATDLGRYPEALSKFDLSLKLAGQAGDTETMGFIINNIGIVHYDLGDFETSTKYFQRAIDLGIKVDSGRILWEAFLDLANATKKLGRTDEAQTHYLRSIEVIENVRATLGLEELKASYLGTNRRIEAYYSLIDLLAGRHRSAPDKGYDAEAFATLEKAKARSFLDSFEVAQVSISRAVDAKLANEENRINGAIAALYKKLLSPDLSPAQKKDIAGRLGASEAEYERFKRTIRAADPVYANLKYPSIITAEAARAALPDAETAVLAYAVGRESSFGFALTRGALRVFPLAPRKDLLPRVAAYLGALSDRDARDFSGGRGLYAELVGAAGLGPGIKRLIVVPDDALAYLPFDALRTDDGHWLVERFAVSYAPSLSSLREIRERIVSRRTPPAKDLLAFGDPDYGKSEKAAPAAPLQDIYSPGQAFARLRYSAAEVRSAAAAFRPDRTDVFLRDQASEPTLKRLNLEDYRIIHFAAHGWISDQNPLRSAIVLAQNPASLEDGFLQMREIYGLRLQADLVVLSACGSGRGQLVRGEGLEGLSRAFFYSGAAAVMMSFWEVDDKAGALFMEKFYAELGRGASIVDAQRTAKLGLLADPATRHPYYWASLIVSGVADRRIK